MSAPVVPRPAASLILLRDGPDGLETLVGRRAGHIRVFPGATVFPGGKVEAEDRAWPGSADDPRLAAAYGALRETFEETGLLVCRDGRGAPAEADVEAARVAAESGVASFPGLLDRWGRELDPARLTAFSHWITPEGAPYRFDTWFFVAAASPAEAQARLVCAEFETLSWAPPALLLTDPQARLITVTRRNLEILAESGGVAQALAAAKARAPYEGRPSYEPTMFGP